ncbi:MAG: toll/interleukin-1 receptor domain-containing protein, partial [Rhodomicrobium sp.]
IDREGELRGVQTLQVPVARGTIIQVNVDGRGLEVDEGCQSVVWLGQPVALNFSCFIPATAKVNTFQPVVRFAVDGQPAGRVLFQIKVDENAMGLAGRLVGDYARRYNYAFLSYASGDRGEVLKRAQALRAAGINFFQDILSLNPGERFEKKIHEHIDNSDLFMLFWSRHALASKWVQKEAEYALECQKKNSEGLPDIVPIMLENLKQAPPPDKLNHIHFNDLTNYLIDVETAPPKRRWLSWLFWSK